MNKNNAKEFLPLVQALADGKTIQGFFEPTAEWRDLTSPDFSNWPPEKFRIKPEPPKPREWNMWEENGKIYNGQVPFSKRIRVREIIEE